MKTITEFAGSTLKNALKTRQELVTAGKTPEELPGAMGEALKLEGDKLTILLNAIEVVEKKADDLKRVVVWSLQEGEKAPRGTEQKGEHYFAIEFFPPLPGQGPRKQGRGGKRDGKRDDRKRGKRRERGPRRGAAPQGDAAQQTGAPEGGAGGENKRRRRWKPRGPRKEGPAVTAPPADPGKPLPLIQPKKTTGDSAPPTPTESASASESK